MKITFLGTGTSQGVPVIACDCAVCKSLDFRDKRTRSSVLVETGDQTIVIDSGPDFRNQMLRERVKKIDALIFTHAHKDHTAGLDDIRSFNFIQKKAIPIYAKPEVISQLKNEFAYIFADNSYPGVPRLVVNEIDDNPFTIDKLKIVPIPVLHYKMPVLGFRIGEFTYITDANAIPEESLKKIKGSHVLVLNALQREKHISHFNLEEAIEVAKKLKPGKTYLTHISHKLGSHRNVSQELPESIELSYDGLQVEL